MWLILFTGEKLKPLLTAPFKPPINFSSTKCEFLYVMHCLLVATSSEFISRNVIRNTILFLSWELSCCTGPFFPDPLRETCTGFVVTVPCLIKRLTHGFDAFPIFFFLVKFQSLLNHFPLGWLQRKTGLEQHQGALNITTRLLGMRKWWTVQHTNPFTQVIVIPFTNKERQDIKN